MSQSLSQSLADAFPLKQGRVHEVVGHGGVVFAAIAAGMARCPDRKTGYQARAVLWLVEGWRSDQLNPHGLAAFCDPEHLLLVRVPDHKSMQACAEEALRSGAVAAVVAEMAQPVSFTAGRRLQLAAEEGRATGILLIGEGMGTNAAESRWHCAPLFRQTPADSSLSSSAGRSGDSTLQRWQIIKNKSGTLGSWDIIWDAETRRVIVVSEAGERPHYAAPTGDDAFCAHVAAE
ncbi:ImuA family protein [Cohaesibacter intestini]|uniref:ImuA family protein n=1 Tax=Cohaesibacter intestini TaxID=2211145 RepID=UPI000DE983F2|nr:hypothetical protein [Cohaesibacter intestini]